MERKIKTLVCAATLLAGLGAAMIPAASFAADPIRTSKDGTVVAKINPVLTLTIDILNADGYLPDGATQATATGLKLNVAPNMVAHGAFKTTVASNTGHNLYVHAKDNETRMINTAKEDVFIPTAGTGTPACTVTSGTTCWGLAKLSGISSDGDVTKTKLEAATYGGLAQALGAGAIFNGHTSAVSPNDDDTKDKAITYFGVAISVDSELAAGTYSGTIVVTASAI